MVDEVVEFDKFTEPMKQLLSEFVANPQTGVRGFVGASAHGGRQCRRRIRATCKSGPIW